MSRPTPIILGEVLFDCFPDGRRVLGGAPFNVAWHLRGLGADPLFISAIGDDVAGGEILERMRSHGLRTDGVQIRGDASTGRVDVLRAEHSPEYHFPETSAWDCVEGAEAALPPEADMLYQGSLFLRRETSRRSASALRKRFASRCFVDVNLRAPWYSEELIRDLVQNAHCLKASEDELDLLLGWFHLPLEGSLEARLRALLGTSGVHHAFITRGAEGAVWASADGSSCRMPAAPVTHFVDSVGAGDASASIALLGLLQHWPAPVILERAMQFAARICEIPGAIPSNNQVYDEAFQEWNRLPSEE